MTETLADNPFTKPFIVGYSGSLHCFQSEQAQARAGSRVPLTRMWSVKVDAKGEGGLTDAKVMKIGNTLHALVLINYTVALVDTTTRTIRKRFGTNVVYGPDHAVELIPGPGQLPYVVMASSSTNGACGLHVHEWSTGKEVQQATLASGHAVTFDQQNNVLWAGGTSVYPHVKEGTKKEDVYSVLLRFPLTSSGAKPLGAPETIPMPVSDRYTNGDKPGYEWREGLHDFTPVPGERKLLINTDVRPYEHSLGQSGSEQFPWAEKGMMAGFMPRLGEDKWMAMKSVSIANDGDIMVAQADEGTYSDEDTYYTTRRLAIFRPSTKQTFFADLPEKTSTYKAKFLQETDGWGSANIPLTALGS